MLLFHSLQNRQRAKQQLISSMEHWHMRCTMPDALRQICYLILDRKLQGMLLLPGKAHEALITNRTFTHKTFTLNEQNAV